MVSTTKHLYKNQFNNKWSMSFFFMKNWLMHWIMSLCIIYLLSETSYQCEWQSPLILLLLASYFPSYMSSKFWCIIRKSNAYLENMYSVILTLKAMIFIYIKITFWILQAQALYRKAKMCIFNKGVKFFRACIKLNVI